MQQLARAPHARRIVLLTATVQPHAASGGLAVIDPEVRRDQYLSAFEHMFRSVPSGVAGIVVGENSAFNLDPFRRLAKSVGCSVPIEFVEAPPMTDVPGRPGRAYLEAHLIYEAMMKSDLVDDRAVVWKLTGRYTVPNLDRVICDRALPYDLYFNVRRYPRPWADMFLFGATRYGMSQILDHVDLLREDATAQCAEQSLVTVLRDLEAKGTGVDWRFPVETKLSGTRGYDGRPYESPKQRVKYAIRASSRFALPRLWL